jgi:tRNA modification GTPase
MVLNKTDVAPVQVAGAIHISAKQGDNIKELEERLVSEIQGDFSLGSETIVSNARHYEALVKTADALEKADTGLDSGVTADFVAMDIRQAMFHLGCITGDISTDDLLGNIFSKFCIGK